MIKIIENKMMEQNAQAIKYLKVEGIKNAKGTIKKINSQINRDFGLVGPFALSTVSERVHSVRWANAREIFVVETDVKRVVKETIAAGIAQTNKCAYCEDVHEASIASAGDKKTSKAIANGTWESLENEKIKSLIEWCLNTRNPNSQIILNPPFSQLEAPEIIGTALVFHSTNRLASIFLEKSPLPKFIANSFFKKSALNIASKTLFKSMVLKKSEAGDSLQFITDYVVSDKYKWASNVPAYSKVIAAKDMLLEEIKRELIPTKTAQLFNDKVNEWKGEEMPLGKAWINNIISALDENEKPIAKIIFLSAFAPYTLTENDIKDFRKTNPTDKELLEVSYWAIQIITNKISEWLAKPFQS